MLNDLNDFLFNALNSVGVYAPILSCLLILIESMVPILPLCVFITINFIYFGNIIGFIISWIFTCIGCYISYLLVLNGKRLWKNHDIESKNILSRFTLYVSNISMPALSLIIALPFTPAFMINIACGIVKMDKKKFITSILIGKIFMVYFWGYIGTGFIDSLKNPIILIKIVLLLILSYLVSFILMKILNKKNKS